MNGYLTYLSLSDLLPLNKILDCIENTEIGQQPTVNSSTYETTVSISKLGLFRVLIKCKVSLLHFYDLPVLGDP